MTDDDVQDRLDRLESLVEQHQAEIDRQKETIADQQDTIERQRQRIAELERQQSADTDQERPIADGTSVKVLGEIDANDATGVLGRANGSGQTYGVRGEASATSGYGLSTPNDAEVGGTTELTTLGGPLTGGTAVTDLIGRDLTVTDGEVLLGASQPSPRAPSNPSAVLSNMDGTGASSDPYVITTDRELQAMNADLSAHYVLGRDIDATFTNLWYSGRGFDPVGDLSNGFTGSFDGRGHTITGLTIDRSSTDFIGLFAQTDPGTTVENVQLADADITGEDDVGGIAGLHDGTIQQVAVGGSVTGTGSLYTGGIVGFNDAGSLRQSFATASVSGDEDVGGLAGRNNSGTVELSFAAGQVSGNTDVGGIVGDNGSTVQDAYYDSQATGQSSAIGTNNGSSNDLTGLTTSEMQGSSAESNMSLLDFTNVWTTRPSDYPTLQVLVD